MDDRRAIDQTRLAGARLALSLRKEEEEEKPRVLSFLVARDAVKSRIAARKEERERESAQSRGVHVYNSTHAYTRIYTHLHAFTCTVEPVTGGEGEEGGGRDSRIVRW